MLYIIIINIVLSFVSASLSLERSLIITTTSGPVKGRINNYNGIKFYSYQGIPYAESTAGKLRFKPPLPKKPWTNILDATKEGAICSQLTAVYNMSETSEDCLNVNVYVPANGTDKLLPVMVFIHGGALQYLSGHISYCQGPQFFLAQEIIFVTMNYRLGPFGFLSLGIEEASGNAALKDVILSLKWIKENIERFGGNANKITVSGHSSGSLIVNYLMLTNQSYNLFNQAILFSGNAFHPRSFAKHPKDIAFALAEELRINTDNVYDTLNHLQNLDAFDILLAHGRMSMRHDSPIRKFGPFVPSVEVKSDHALFIEDPLKAFRKNGVMAHKVPAIVGFTGHEAISIIPYVLSQPTGLKKLHENPENLIPSNIEYPFGSQKSKNLARMINELYFGGDDMKNMTLNNFIEFLSDTQYVFGTHYWMKRYKNMVDSDALYFYIFDFIGAYNRCNMFFKSSVNGACHGDDTQYFLLTEMTQPIIGRVDKRSQQMMDRMIKLLSNFIYYGNPTPDGVDNEFKWLDYGQEQNYLLLKENPVVEKFSSNPMYKRMQFWEKVYKEFYDYEDNGGEIQKKIIP